jgi:hypothetical protein
MRVRVVERLRLTIKPLGNRAEKPIRRAAEAGVSHTTKNSKKSALRGSYEFPSFQQRRNVTQFIKYDKFTA